MRDYDSPARRGAKSKGSIDSEDPAILALGSVDAATRAGSN